MAESRTRRNIVRLLSTHSIESNPLYNKYKEEVLNSLLDNDCADGVNIFVDSSHAYNETNSLDANDSIGNMETSITVPWIQFLEDLKKWTLNNYCKSNGLLLAPNQ